MYKNHPLFLLLACSIKQSLALTAQPVVARCCAPVTQLPGGGSAPQHWKGKTCHEREMSSHSLIQSEDVSGFS